MGGQSDEIRAEQYAALYCRRRIIAARTVFTDTAGDSGGKTDRHDHRAQRYGLDAFVLFKQPVMAVFFLFAMLLGAVLQITNTFGNPFLHDFGRIAEYKDTLVVQYPSVLLSVSQMAEVVFILAIPYFLKRYGIKTVMLISMIAGHCVLVCLPLVSRYQSVSSSSCCR